MISIYKQGVWGSKIVGSVDENGITYRGEGPDAREIEWSIDDDGRVYLLHEGSRALIGWVEADGMVYVAQGRPVSGFYSFPESPQYFEPRKSFEPSIAFHVSQDGTVYRQGRLGSKPVGRVEGTFNLRKIGALALVLLSWEV